MSSVRISATVRDEIIANVLAHKFVVENATIAEKQGEIELLKAKRDKLGYELAYSEAERVRLKGASRGWFPTAHSVNIMIEDQGVDQVHFGEHQPVPYDHSRYNGSAVAKIVRGDEPYFKVQQEIEARQDELNDLRSNLRAQERAATARVLAVVNSVTTTGKLIEVWPEVRQFLPEIVSSSSGGLPAEFIGDLNNFLNIKS